MFDAMVSMDAGAEVVELDFGFEEGGRRGAGEPSLCHGENGGAAGAEGEAQEEKEHGAGAVRRTEAMLQVAVLTVIAQKWRVLYGRLLVGEAWKGLTDVLGVG